MALTLQWVTYKGVQGFRQLTDWESLNAVSAKDTKTVVANNIVPFNRTAVAA